METTVINATEYRELPLALLNESKTNPRRVFDAVSYTHLDVYKRQALRAMRFLSNVPKMFTLSRKVILHYWFWPRTKARWRQCIRSSVEEFRFGRAI